MPENAPALNTLAAALCSAITTGALVLVCGAASALAATDTVTFATPGEYPIVIPNGVASLHVVAVGGRGGEGTYLTPGGFGARVTATLAVAPGMTRYLLVGGDGKTGVNSAGAGGGGGASDVRTAPASAGLFTDTRILIAGGGGGSGSGYTDADGQTAGPGGNAGAAGGGSRPSKNPGPITSGGGAAGVPAGTGAGGTSGAVDRYGAPGVAGGLGQGGDGAFVDADRGYTDAGFNGGGRGGGGIRAVDAPPFGPIPYKGGGGGGGGLNGGGGGGGIADHREANTANARAGAGGGGGTSLVPAGGSTTTDTAGTGGSITVSFEDSTAPAPSLAGGPARVRGAVTVAGTSGTTLGDGAVTVEVYAGATAAGVPVTATATRDANTGAYTATVGSLGQGPYTVRARQVDGAGLAGLTTTRTVVSDTVAPDLSLTPSAGGVVTNDPAPTFGGLAGTATGDDATVKLEIRDAEGFLVQTASAQRSGATGAYAAQPSPLADGTYTARVKQSDDLGNDAVTGAVAFRVDASGPAVALTSAPVARSTDASPTFAGTAGTAFGDASAVRVRMFTGAAAADTPVAAFGATVDGSGRFTARAAQLPDGTYTATFTQTDAAGNAGTAAPATFTVDTAAPALTLTTPSAGGQATPLTTFAGVGGTAPGDGATVAVAVYAGATAGGELVRTIAAPRDPATGAYGATVRSAFPTGTYTVVATQADDLGNAATTEARTFTVGGGTGGTGGGGAVAVDPAPADRAAPVLTRASLSATRFTVTKTKKTKALKRGTTVLYTLSEDAEVTLAITRSGKSKAITTLTRRSKKGANRIAFSGRIATKALPSGRYTLTLTATDASGNRGTAKRLGFRVG